MLYTLTVNNFVTKYLKYNHFEVLRGVRSHEMSQGCQGRTKKTNW